MFNAIVFVIGNALGGLSVFNYQKYADKIEVVGTKNLVEKVLHKQKKLHSEIEKLSEKAVESNTKLEFLKHLTQSFQNSLLHLKSLGGGENIPFYFIGASIVTCLVLTVVISETSGIHALNEKFDAFGPRLSLLQRETQTSILTEMNRHQASIVTSFNEIAESQENDAFFVRTELNVLKFKLNSLVDESQAHIATQSIPPVDLTIRGQVEGYRSILDNQNVNQN